MIAVRDLAAAARDFSAAGFALTPLGVHSIGSRNHCIMLGATYLELLEPSGAHPWLAYYREFVSRGDGLAALALATADAEASYRELVAQGVAVEPPMDLARPVQIDGRPATARFRLVQVSPEKFLCQHLTRELLWRREWQSHANGAAELVAADFPGGALRIAGLASAVRLHGVQLSPA
ncbi:MAG TPA: VOC family protein [Burkholderiales bacterium]|nr:VOC family protein [Burkholderiales bacterium]